MHAEELMCENCGAEYTVMYDGNNNTDEPVHCPFCGNEKDTFINEDQGELNFDDD